MLQKCNEMLLPYFNAYTLQEPGSKEIKKSLLSSAKTFWWKGQVFDTSTFSKIMNIFEPKPCRHCKEKIFIIMVKKTLIKIG